MPRLDLSKMRSVDALKPPKAGSVDYFDTSFPGFALRVTASGVKTWYVFYRVQDGPDKGRLRRHRLEPRYPALTCKAARESAGDVFARVSAGEDPAAERQAQKKAAPLPRRQDKTFGEVVDEFIEKYAKPRQRTWKETKRTLVVNCAEWLDWPIREIKKADAYDLLDGFVAAGTGYKAARTLGWLRTLFRWAWRRDIVDTPIMDAVEIDFEETHRTRFYSDQEIKAIWLAADELAPVEGGFVKLAMLLGVRKTELAGMRRSEFNDAAKPTVWTVPHERVKIKKSAKKERCYVVPLPALAQRIIRGLPKVHDDLVFPGRHIGKPMTPGSPLQTKVREHSGINDWTYHTCRHTVSTWLQNEGYAEYDRGLVLNHADSSVTAKYSHGFPVERKRELLESWADHVASLIETKGVTRLR